MGEGVANLLANRLPSPLPLVGYLHIIFPKTLVYSVSSDDLKEEGNVPSHFGFRYVHQGKCLVIEHTCGVCVNDCALVDIRKRGFLPHLLNGDGTH